MDFSNVEIGLATAFSAWNILYCLIGVFLGTAIGVLPGLGPVATISMLLPITFGLEPETALIMLAGIYYGAQYGGSTTAILVNLPGESASVVTAIDGYQLARKGQAGKALATAAIGSFVAGTIATLLIALFAPPLADMALEFGPPEYFSLIVLGLVASVVLAHGSLLHAFGMIGVGLLLGLVGIDVNSGASRYTFEFPQLTDGINFVVVAMGLFGIGEIIANLDRSSERTLLAKKITDLMPSLADLREMFGPVMRGTALGSLLGILPGGGAMLSSFASYALEKKLSNRPQDFGHGALAGVAGPESANNAGAQTSFIPMLTLGIPSNPVMALMIGALIVHGIQPGPSVMNEQPALFWGVIISMWIGNVMLLVLNLPLIGLWVKMVSLPYNLLYPTILVFCSIGVFSLNNAEFDIYLMALFGALGYLLRKFDCEPAPLLLGFILGPMMEEYLRRTLLLSAGDPAVFVTRPISLAMLVVAALLLATVFAPFIVKKREEAFQE
ncbi:tripartite tricarboxylate transporter permease [Flaviflagellibacter deserti]|uniref:Tripartite tricarboxylate transporter permease n=1 Tax=Flaviflagellibacter deserti TaxID=2267266 RepID=A0ABV9Z0U0_9HYPH